MAPALANLTKASPPWVFLAGAAGVAVLADWVRRSTEQLTGRVGPAVGGLVAISFGSLAAIILAMFVLANGEAAVVRAQITRSIIGTGLLGLGIAIVAGGIGRERQGFKRERAGLLSSLLILAVIALLLPAVFSLPEAAAGPQRLARQDRMGLVFSICIGSAIQVALVVTPLLVLVSWAIGRPMTLVFDNPLDLFAISGAAFIIDAIAADGETTWFEGVLLIGVDALFALAFFFVG